MSRRAHDHYRDLTAAHVLGALDADEREELEAHLRTCEHCRRDLVAFAPLPALLGRVEATDLHDTAPTGAPDEVIAAVRADIGSLDRSRRRWRWAAAAAATVAVLFGLLTGLNDTAPTRQGQGVALEVEPATAGSTAHVTAEERAWGTYVHVSAGRLPAHDAYELWVVDESGTWHPAGSWAGTDDGAASLGASSQLTLAEIDRIVVTAADRGEEILVAR